METVDTLFDSFLDEVDETSTTALKAKFVRMINRTSRTIQPFAGVEKVWSTLAIVASTETYDISSSHSDFFRAYEGRFLKTSITDELGNYDFYEVIQSLDWGGTGFWVSQAKTLYLRPKPANAGNLKIYGEKVLTTLDFTADVGAGETATPEIDAELHDIYLWDACRRYGTQDEDTEGKGSRYAVYTGLYNELETELRRRYIERDNERKINRS